MSGTQEDAVTVSRNGVAPVWLIRFLEGLSAASIFAIAVLVFTDVILRYFFNSPMRGALEIISLLMGFMTMSALPLVTEQRTHITIDVIDGLLRGAVRYTIQLIILAFQMIMLGFITWRIYAIAEREWNDGWITVDLEISRAPLLFIMASFGALTTVIVFVMIIQFLRGRLPVIPIGGFNTGADDL